MKSKSNITGSFVWSLVFIALVSYAALLSGTVASAQAVSFGPATNFPVGSVHPGSVAIGDLNGDGKPDLATANIFGDNVSILLGTGTGGFGAATIFPVGAHPTGVAIADLNGDGKPDLAVANRHGGGVSILLGTGTGVFGAATNFPAGIRPISVAIGDLNGDGKPDLATANSGFVDDVSVLPGDGTGAFGAATNFVAGASPSFVAIGDLNGDGKPDLAVTNAYHTSNNVSILLGTGTGAFGAATNFGVGTGPQSVAIADLNGDGKPDLAVANEVSHNVSILLGTGTGAFGAAKNLEVGGIALSVAIADLNGDRKPDLAVAGGKPAVSILLGTGTGIFGAATDFAAPGSSSVAIGDLNRDGKPDLAMTNNQGNSVSVLLNNTVRDTTPPETTITSAVDGNGAAVAGGGSTLSGSITITFGGTDAIGVVGFQCRLDGAAYASCTSPAGYPVLSLGNHTFQVRALDAAGNSDPSPASFNWAVVTPAQAIRDLINTINNMGLARGLATSLTAPLSNINTNNKAAACGKLNAFIDQVNSKIPPLTVVQATQLLREAKAIKAGLGCQEIDGS